MPPNESNDDIADRIQRVREAFAKARARSAPESPKIEVTHAGPKKEWNNIEYIAFDNFTNFDQFHNFDNFDQFDNFSQWDAKWIGNYIEGDKPR
jgi:hypothetical protein